MRHQAIQYDPATGQIRQVLDPEHDCGPEVVHLLRPEPHEAVIAHDKAGGARYHEWQLTVTRACGKLPAGLHPEVADFVRAKL